MIYSLFKDRTSQDAYPLALYIGLTDQASTGVQDAELFQQDPSMLAIEFERWLRFGSYVNLSWLEGKGELQGLLMSQYEFESLRSTQRDLHQKIKSWRTKANQRWHNDWKQIHPRIEAGKALACIRPNPAAIALSWQSHASICARRLQQVGMEGRAKQILDLSLSELAAEALA